jgi:hypothetical protein
MRTIVVKVYPNCLLVFGVNCNRNWGLWMKGICSDLVDTFFQHLSCKYHLDAFQTYKTQHLK